jgi:hypothetical protein
MLSQKYDDLCNSHYDPFVIVLNSAKKHGWWGSRLISGSSGTNVTKVILDFRATTKNARVIQSANGSCPPERLLRAIKTSSKPWNILCSCCLQIQTCR